MLVAKSVHYPISDSCHCNLPPFVICHYHYPVAAMAIPVCIQIVSYLAEVGFQVILKRIQLARSAFTLPKIQPTTPNAC